MVARNGSDLCRHICDIVSIRQSASSRSARAGRRGGFMKESKSTFRYLGHRTLAGGARGFDFSIGLAGTDTTMITIEAPAVLFTGPGHIALQEGAGICYETLKVRIEVDSENPPASFTLTREDVAQHRKITKPHGLKH